MTPSYHQFENSKLVFRFFKFFFFFSCRQRVAMSFHGWCYCPLAVSLQIKRRESGFTLVSQSNHIMSVGIMY